MDPTKLSVTLVRLIQRFISAKLDIVWPSGFLKTWTSLQQPLTADVDAKVVLELYSKVIVATSCYVETCKSILSNVKKVVPITLNYSITLKIIQNLGDTQWCFVCIIAGHRYWNATLSLF